MHIKLASRNLISSTYYHKHTFKIIKDKAIPTKKKYNPTQKENNLKFTCIQQFFLIKKIHNIEFMIRLSTELNRQKK